MSDWTTRKLSDRTEVDFHYDLDSFPMVIRDTENGKTIVLSRAEVIALRNLLKGRRL